ENVSIGRPISNTQVYVLDEAGQPVPIGVPGELYTGGDGLAREYVGRQELTEEKFVSNPFVPDERLYRTGDKVRWREDGLLEFLGRIDQQIKIRGYRIEPGEVEAALVSHPTVQQATVVAFEVTPGDKQLVGYVVLEGNTEITMLELRRDISAALPEYMVPGVIVKVDSIPLTPNGKVDRRALPEPDYVSEVEEYIAPNTDTEGKLAGIWELLLRSECIGRNDHFFHRGGHSLLATQLVSHIRESFSVEVSVAQIFKTSILKDLAVEIDQATGDNILPPIVPRQVKGDVPLSYAQQRLWFLQQLEPESPAYNCPFIYKIKGDLQYELLELALNEMIHRHESLRTYYPIVGQEPAQRVLPSMPLLIQKIDFTEVSKNEREGSALSWAQEQARIPFNLENPPLLRAALIKLEDNLNWFILVKHHIITDGWSMQIFTKQLKIFYEQLIQKQGIKFTEPVIQYSDFSEWQNRCFHEKRFAGQKMYWENKLRNVADKLELPLDYKRPAIQNFSGSQCKFSIPKPLVNLLQGLCKETDTTLFMALLTAWYAVMYRYSGQEDIVIGAPIANRNRSDLEEVLGFFVNTLPLRLNVTREGTFRSLLLQVREITLEAYANQDIPFEHIIEAIGIERNMSYNPLFQVMFVLQSEEVRSWTVGNTDWVQEDIDNQTAKFDLNLEIISTSTGLEGRLVYNTNLYDFKTVSRMTEHFQMLLSGAVMSPDICVSTLPLLTEWEQKKLLLLNSTERNYPLDLCLADLIERQVAKTPDQIAVINHNNNLTFHELNVEANKLAHRLQQMGASSNTLIGLYMERSLEMVIAMLAIVKSGAAYVPIDPTYPSERVENILKDAAIKILLTDRKVIGDMKYNINLILYLDEERMIPHEGQEANPMRESGSDRLAYVMYTSGTTGQPKGVMISHRAICNRLHWMKEEYSVSETDTIFHKTPISFDVSVWEVFLPLMTGAKLIISTPGGHKDTQYMVRMILLHRVTMIHFIPSMLQLMLDEADFSNCTSLKFVFSGGETLPYELLERLLEKLPAEIHNRYGPTEISINATYWPSERNKNKIVKIGKPLANTQVYVLDANREMVPIGVPGELFVGGTSLAEGYLHRQDLTDEKFIFHTFSKDRKAKLYRTGDWVRCLSDGNLEFLGRMDQQVKIRGFRIELGEIEKTLGLHSSVRDAVVIVKEHHPHNNRLIAFVTAHSQEDIVPSRLMQYLERRLPEYMLPVIVQIDKIPLMSSGKVDRKALEQMDVKFLERQSVRVEPRTESERTVARLVEEIMGFEDIGIEDNLFELGANSLSLARMAILIRETFDIEFPTRLLFDKPTVKQLAYQIDTKISSKLNSNNLTIDVDHLSENEMDTLLLSLIEEGWE
ncbi:hypothetical protein BSK54_15895, partial [Paenibacillus odorifer]